MKEALLFAQDSQLGTMRALRWAQPLVALLVVSGRLASGFECDGRVIPDAWLNDDYW